MTASRAGHGSRELLEFLKTKRWFGDKARAISAAAVRDDVHVEWPNSDKPYSVLRVDVTTDAGRSTYQVFIERGTSQLRDALEDPDFRRGLVDAFVQNLAFQGSGGVTWRFTSEGRQSLVVPAKATIRLSGAEQSNSSVIVDGQAILKLFRKLEPGVHPDVEVTRFLTIERQFVHVPVLLGTILFEEARGKGGTTIAGMLQELVPGAVDAWTYALAESRSYFGGGGDFTAPPFAADAEELGVITRALHETLGSGDPGSDFERRDVQDSDLQAWTRRTQDMISRASASLRRAMTAGNIPGRAMHDAQAVDAAAGALSDRLPGRIRRIGADRGAMTRTHGDFHLGQIIRSSAGQFLVIDFEGEPARPLGARRAHQSPLRDVAGMLRSFAYAAAVGSMEGGRGDAHAIERARTWEQHAREAFLRGYFRDGSAGNNRILTSSRANADHLITLFETEKIFYELQYELDHRPEWVWIPLSGIATLLT